MFSPSRAFALASTGAGKDKGRKASRLLGQVILCPRMEQLLHG